MFEFFRQSSEFVSGGRVGYFFFFFIFITFLWLIKIFYARKYRPYVNEHRAFISVIVPVVDEPPNTFTEVLHKIKQQRPEEIIVVLNGPKNDAIEAIGRHYADKFIYIPTPGKREAVAAGIRVARHEVIILVDSDTYIQPNCFIELVKPFEDPTIGGVTTHQEILNANANLITRFASWMEKARGFWSFPAMSVHGTVGCLPGRAIAFRREILVKAIHPFLNEEFLGFHPQISDDRALTNITLKMGYKTVYQRTARCLTPAPETLKKFLKQQYRWSRGSQYSTLMMTRWMIKNARFLCLLFWSEILVPFWLVAIYLLTFFRYCEGSLLKFAVAVHLILAFVGSIVSLFLRQVWVYKDAKKEIKWLPIILAMVSVLMVPIRILGFVTCGYNIGWQTRDNAIGGAPNKSLKRFIPILLAIILVAIPFTIGLLTLN